MGNCRPQPHHHFSLSPLEEARSPHLGRTDLIGGIQRELISTLLGLSRVNPLSLSSQAKYLCFGTGWRSLEFAPVPRQRIMGDYFWDMTSLRSPGWSQTGGAPDPPSTASSWVLEVQAAVTTPMLTFYAGKLFNHANKNPSFPRATKSDNHLLGIGPLLISDAVSAAFCSLIGGWVSTALCLGIPWEYMASHFQLSLATGLLYPGLPTPHQSYSAWPCLFGWAHCFFYCTKTIFPFRVVTWVKREIIHAVHRMTPGTQAAHTTWNRVPRTNLAFVYIRQMLWDQTTAPGYDYHQYHWLSNSSWSLKEQN